jgi:hypothetical protein
MLCRSSTLARPLHDDDAGLPFVPGMLWIRDDRRASPSLSLDNELQWSRLVDASRECLHERPSAAVSRRLSRRR